MTPWERGLANILRDRRAGRHLRPQGGRRWQDHAQAVRQYQEKRGMVFPPPDLDRLWHVAQAAAIESLQRRCLEARESGLTEVTVAIEDVLLSLDDPPISAKGTDTDWNERWEHELRGRRR